MVCGLRGPESPCWQTRDMTECIVHTLPGSGNTFCSTISSFCLCIIAFAPLSLLHSPWPPAFVMPPFPPSPPSSPCFGLAHFSDHRQWLNIPSCPLALAWQRQPVFLLLPLDYCAVIHPAFKHWPSSTCGFILIYHNIFFPFFPHLNLPIMLRVMLHFCVDQSTGFPFCFFTKGCDFLQNIWTLKCVTEYLRRVCLPKWSCNSFWPVLCKSTYNSQKKNKLNQ